MLFCETIAQVHNYFVSVAGKLPTDTEIQHGAGVGIGQFLVSKSLTLLLRLSEAHLIFHPISITLRISPTFRNNTMYYPVGLMPTQTYGLSGRNRNGVVFGRWGSDTPSRLAHDGSSYWMIYPTQKRLLKITF